MAVREFFDESVVTAKDGTKNARLVPNARSGAFLAALTAGLMTWARENIKITLPSSIPGLGGVAPSVGQAAGLMLSGPIKDFLPRDVKAFAPQIGMAIGERLGPMLEGFLSGFQAPGSKTRPKPGTEPEVKAGVKMG